ncbi:Glycine betaine ABC transport system, glycine betaine-binding protein OpuAC [Candidatus Syntrophocurvum alkaliphilum]|uniref:Glycine betaine ABC transport system, glycine betaine-binding protein OpuAC n=1 Tax=Candidatus Syntrophocurvum alkaliphilum TaxID=2293317 RepID=A0A6I6DIX4_9FIRM|nr:glycine betaine ABC transporter substrate-binding protein [Candidatus Syntrophocurvum alkaliphilum]QGU00151.1 Glycine betaine ABC transport system, glycine betaine-binding protein OpuAC [Candidatus Syntrophocurvum alkaliphilum]
MLKMRSKIALLTIIALIAFSVVGCGTTAQDEEPVKIVYVEWSCATAASHVVAEVLESEMGYDVELIPVGSNVVIYEALANRDADVTVCAWLPVTDGEYVERHADSLENLGPNMEGAIVGFGVPEYVTIDSVKEMNDYKHKFDQKIVGIEAGTGIMINAEDAIVDYNLDFELIESSDAGMTAELDRKIAREEWVVITAWSPHWKFSRFDLKFLDEPKNSFTDEEHIDTIIRKGYGDEQPEVVEFLDNVYFETEELARAMDLAQDEGATPVTAAQEWVAENEDIVNSWLQ